MVDLVAARAGLIEQLRRRAFKPVDDILDSADIYGDLGINGADLAEVLDWVNAMYGTDLRTITPKDYDINEPPGYWFSQRPYKAVRISEILAAIERGYWIVPN
jgi:hypothetical protein